MSLQRDIALAASLGLYWHYHYDYTETRQTDKIQLNVQLTIITNREIKIAYKIISCSV